MLTLQHILLLQLLPVQVCKQHTTHASQAQLFACISLAVHNTAQLWRSTAHTYVNIPCKDTDEVQVLPVPTFTFRVTIHMLLARYTA